MSQINIIKLIQVGSIKTILIKCLYGYQSQVGLNETKLKPFNHDFEFKFMDKKIKLII